MSYTVKQLARLAGVYEPSLHYYDEIGLLKPSSMKENGYRCYEEKDAIKLQQILFFRELDFALENILQIIDAPKYKALEALADQRMLLKMKGKPFHVYCDPQLHLSPWRAPLQIRFAVVVFLQTRFSYDCANT